MLSSFGTAPGAFDDGPPNGPWSTRPTRCTRATATCPLPGRHTMKTAVVRPLQRRAPPASRRRPPLCAALPREAQAFFFLRRLGVHRRGGSGRFHLGNRVRGGGGGLKEATASAASSAPGGWPAPPKRACGKSRRLLLLPLFATLALRNPYRHTSLMSAWRRTAAHRLDAATAAGEIGQEASNATGTGDELPLYPVRVLPRLQDGNSDGHAPDGPRQGPRAAVQEQAPPGDHAGYDRSLFKRVGRVR